MKAKANELISGNTLTYQQLADSERNREESVREMPKARPDIGGNVVTYRPARKRRRRKPWTAGHPPLSTISMQYSEIYENITISQPVKKHRIMKVCTKEEK